MAKTPNVFVRIEPEPFLIKDEIESFVDWYNNEGQNFTSRKGFDGLYYSCRGI